LDRYYAGRVAVITGAGSGIGRALSVRLAGAGAQLALLDRDGPAAEATARHCRDAGARAWVHAVDVTDQDAVERCAAAAVAEFGGRVSTGGTGRGGGGGGGGRGGYGGGGGNRY